MRDVLVKIVEKLKIICPALSGKLETVGTLEDTVGTLEDTVSDLGGTVFTTEYTLLADLTVGAGAMKEVDSANLTTLIPAGATFVSASLKGGTTANMGRLIIQKVWWGDTPFLGVINPADASLTIPAGKIFEIVYAK